MKGDAFVIISFIGVPTDEHKDRRQYKQILSRCPITVRLPAFFASASGRSNRQQSLAIVAQFSAVNVFRASSYNRPAD